MAGNYALQDPDGKDHPIEGIIQIGRDRLNHIHLTDPMISRLHATAWMDGEKVFLQDEGSSNGTMVNGMPVRQPIALQVGDRVQVGHTTLILVDTRAGWIHEAPPPMPIQAPAPPAPPRKSNIGVPLALAALAGLTILACIIIGVVGYRYFNALRTNPQPSFVNPEAPASNQDTQSAFGFEEIQTVTATSDGTRYYDEQGISLRVPRDATVEGATTHLVSSDLDPVLVEALSGEYNVSSLAYQVAANGAENGTGRPELSFPVSSDNARLAVMIDETYLAVLAIEPEDGALTINPFLSAPQGESLWVPEDVPVSANQYFVLEPVSGDGAGLQGPVPALMRVEGGQKVSGNARISPDYPGVIYCGYTKTLISECLRNPEGSVFLTFNPQETPADFKPADAIQSILGIMGRYATLGFTAAGVSPSNPIYIVIGSSGPSYSSKTGNLYIPWVTVNSLSQGEEVGSLAHEMAHWIQDEKYAMTFDALSNPGSWWLEVAAENMIFLYEPGQINVNLSKYGFVSVDGGRYSFQLAPYLWSWGEQARYIHAQHVKLGMCDGGAGCLFSQAEFVNAINTGIYLMEDSGRKAVYNQNLTDVARYLLGFRPVQSNTALAPPPTTQAGNRVGEYILVAARGESSIFDHLSDAPQFVATKSEVRIQAQIEPGGVYPLRVSNTGKGLGVNTAKEPGFPVFLEIEPGSAPFLFTVNNSEPIQESGGRHLFIGPIHDTLGTSMVRLVGMAPNGATTLKARVGYLDLSGDWVMDTFQVTAQSSSCDDGGEDDDDDEPLEQELFLDLLAGYGTFVRDPAGPQGNKLIWEQSDPFPEDFGTLSFSATAELGKEDVKLNYLVDIPPGSTSWAPGNALGLHPTKRKNNEIWALALPLGGFLVLFTRARRREGQLLLALAGIALLLGLNGCVLDVYGEIRGEYTFKNLSYLSENYEFDRPGPEIWALGGGEGTINLDLTIVDEDEDGEIFEERCFVTVETRGNAFIVADGNIGPPDFEDE